MKIEKHKILGWIFIVIFIILSLILILQLTLRIVGHSPTDIQILYVTVGVLVSYLLMMSYKAGVFVGEMNGFVRESKEFMKITKNSFKKLRNDIKK